MEGQAAKNIFEQTHDTVIIGWDKITKEVVWLKSYHYQTQTTAAQADLKAVIDAGLNWVIQDASLIFRDYEEKKPA